MQVIELLDGQRELRELECILPDIPRKQIRSLLSSLQSVGLLTNGSDKDDDDIPSANRETMSFLARFINMTGTNERAQDAYRKLQRTHLLIIDATGEGLLAKTLQSVMLATGLGSAVVVERRSMTHADLETDSTLESTILVSLVTEGEDIEWHLSLDQWCRTTGVPWFRAVINSSANHADLGPWFNSKKTPCYECLQHVQTTPTPISDSPINSVGATNGLFFTALLATALIYSITELCHTTLLSEFRRYNLDNWQFRDLIFCSLPGCPNCLPDAQIVRTVISGGPGHLNTALAYEEYVSFREGVHTDAATKDSDQSRIASLIRQSKHFGNNVKSLPEEALMEMDIFDAMRTSQDAPGGRIQLSHLANILKMASGIRNVIHNEGKVRRWAPSSGNLGSVEVYVVVRAVDGLSPGFYFYQPWEHSLACLQCGENSLSVDEFAQRVLPQESYRLPDSMLILTGALHRIAEKYGIFGYKLMQFDAGVALSQMQILANSLGLRSWIPSQWADDLLEFQFGLEPMREQPTGIISLWHSGNWKPIQTVSQHAPLLPVIEKSENDLSKLGRLDLVKMLYHESRRREQDLQPGRLLMSSSSQVAEGKKPNGIPLAQPLIKGESVDEILHKRVTVRRYFKIPIPLECLSTILHHGARDSNTPALNVEGESPLLSFLVTAQAVDSVDSGVYYYDSRYHHLELAMPPLDDKRMKELFIQPDLASAPAQIWIIGNLTEACGKYGTWGYRHLLVRAGMAVQRLSLSAIGTGLDGAIIAGIVPSAVRSNLGIDGVERRALLTFTVGFSSLEAKALGKRRIDTHEGPRFESSESVLR
jgi:SagB-type dehydrogenase family enzyme